MEELAFDAVKIVERPGKPRTRGITYVRDPGMGVPSIIDAFQANAEYIDILKLSGVTPRLQTRKLIAEKVAVCRDFNVSIGLGGPIMETAILQGPDTVHRFLDQLQAVGIEYLEVCRSVVVLPLPDLCELIGVVKEHGIKPIAENGVAYGITEDDTVNIDVPKLISSMKACLEAGAWKVLLESEGITESRRPEDYRFDIASSIASAIDMSQVMLEGDEEMVYTRYLLDHGSDINLFVDLSRVMQLEAARLGLWGKQPIISRMATYSRHGHNRR